MRQGVRADCLQDAKVPGVHLASGNPCGGRTNADWYSRTHADVLTRLWRQAWRLAAFTLLGSSACTGLSRIGRDPLTAPAELSSAITLRGRRFDLHLAVPPRPKAPDVLVLYASGDGGWFGAATDMFRATGAAGYYAVGLSTRTLLRIESSKGAPAVAQLADDYRDVVGAAAAALDLPPNPRVILTGWSRGAALAILVAGSERRPANVAGVVAIGLGAGEDLATDSDTDEEPDEEDGVRRPGALDTYSLLARLGPIPCAVIQATGDRYLRATRARGLFGPDTASRRFFEVEARNHRFGGGAEGFADALHTSLSWIAGYGPVPVR